MPHWSSLSWRCWLGTGQAGHCVLIVSCCDWLLGRALPAYTSLPGCPQRTVRLQCWTCQLAPRSPSYEGSGAQWQGRKGITVWHSRASTITHGTLNQSFITTKHKPMRWGSHFPDNGHKLKQQTQLFNPRRFKFSVPEHQAPIWKWKTSSGKTNKRGHGGRTYDACQTRER